MLAWLPPEMFTNTVIQKFHVPHSKVQ